jgi:heme-degrading monooxygenase HmoA
MRISKEHELITLINVFDTTPEQQQVLIDQWVRFTEEVRNEPGYLGTALHKCADGTRVINYARFSISGGL